MAARILVVEDDRDSLAMFLQLLSGWGYEVEGATTAHGALEQIRQHCPDVVLSDLVMPGMTGIELLRAIRSQKDCRVAFFLVTGHGGVSVAVNAICEGADDCMLKPIEPDALRTKLQSRGFYGSPA